MPQTQNGWIRGAAQAIAAALLFGMTAPLAKQWLAGTPPLLASGLLYLASGLTLGAWLVAGRAAIGAARSGRGSAESPLRRADLPYLGGAIVIGGVIAPALLLYGLSVSTGTVASLLLNLETVFTVLIAVALGESIGWRAGAGIAAILLGSTALAVDPAHAGSASWLGAAAIAGACACWGLDNNLIQRISGKDPVAIAAAKCLVAAPVSLALAFAVAGGTVGAAASAGSGLGVAGPSGSGLGGAVVGESAVGETLASAAAIAASAWAGLSAEAARVWLPALVLGAVGYGLSIVFFVRALRSLGAARTGSLFATAPFAGALGAIVLLREAPTWPLLAAGAAMALGVVLISGDQHDHEHAHEPHEHEHLHRHDEHHRHEHDGTEGPEPHSHIHRHARLVHNHSHVPDIHHRHRHD